MEILLLGFGEAGQAFAQGWSSSGLPLTLRSYDVKLEAVGHALTAPAEAFGVRLVGSDASGFGGVRHVVSLVTADQSLVAARQTARHLGPGQVYWDLNSVAPKTKRAAAEIIAASGAVYVDVGVLSPVHPRLHRAPLAVATPMSAPARDAAAAMGWQVAHWFDQVGDAAALKLLRSVVIKGIEALILECVDGGWKLGLTDAVLASLAPSFPGIDWPDRAAYVLERVDRHGPRRAAEMLEAAAFLDDIAIKPTMARATADRLAQGTAMLGRPQAKT